ncbi:conjugal transfer protein TraX [Paenibacillus radicis (ex Xue et al. 2023)]|uniref:Conjugal transfer protein TraX n=1 Tax=Paenibacillus radicis (ex Xue et al. 2023) TaxID=2972489 RepID=A0ABT1YB84_9BACL|nr:conjugal transfer protein TraX [Paenibacillus radicis (ex Xue et al. 2023)]MCR8629669.1 conjugal transfer protein TraX [Paenibacillus radicis (ex Xue et al. 2023)]
MTTNANGWERPLLNIKPLGMQRELLQIVAMLTMLIDHIGFVFFPEQWGLRVIGRISFPLYAFGIVQGYLHSGDVKGYIRRLGLLALLSEIPFIMAFNVWKINVIGTFFVCILTLYLLDRISYKIGKTLVLCASAATLIWIPADYGIYALLLIFIYRYVSANLSIPLHFLLNIYYWWSEGVLYQHFSLISTAWLTLGTKLDMRISVPRWLWLSFYPAHLVILVIIKELFF